MSTDSARSPAGVGEPDTREWGDALRSRSAAWREAHPVPDFADATPRQRALAELQGVLFAHFVQETWPGLAGATERLAVWITDHAGLMAADAMLEPDAAQLLAVSPTVMDAHLQACPDAAHRHHVAFATIARGARDGEGGDASAADEPTNGDVTAVVVHVATVWGDGASHEQLRHFRWEGDALVPDGEPGRAVFTIGAQT